GRSVEEYFYEFVRPFDLSDTTLLRAGLLQHHSGNFLFVDIHHIVADGYSFSILINDFKKIYLEQELAPLSMDYVDYAEWLNGSQSNITSQKAFWVNQLSGELSRTNLPMIGDREEVERKYVSYETAIIPGPVYEKVKAFTASNNVSDFIFLLSVYYLLLHKMSGNTDIVIGSEVLGRSKAGLNEVVGTFVNVLPLRAVFSTDSTYSDFLQGVKKMVLESSENQDFQFNQMTELYENDEPERNPFFDYNFTYAANNDGDDELSELDFIPISFNTKFKGEYEFTLRLTEADGRFNINVIYSYELYDVSIIQAMMQFYQNILDEILTDDQLSIEEIQLEKYTDQPTP
ncbi:MAG: condensation domain-containing protein, partial [Bacteroidota bacterium]